MVIWHVQKKKNVQFSNTRFNHTAAITSSGSLVFGFILMSLPFITGQHKIAFVL